MGWPPPPPPLYRGLEMSGEPSATAEELSVSSAAIAFLRIAMISSRMVRARIPRTAPLLDGVGSPRSPA